MPELILGCTKRRAQDKLSGTASALSLVCPYTRTRSLTTSVESKRESEPVLIEHIKNMIEGRNMRRQYRQRYYNMQLQTKVPGLSGTYQPQTLYVGWYVPVADFRAQASIGWYIPASVVRTEHCSKLKIHITTQEFELPELTVI